MTRGWGEVARVCRGEWALAIHFEYDNACTLSFKVFNEVHLALLSPLLGSLPGETAPKEVLVSSSSQGLAPREGLELLLLNWAVLGR